MRGNNNRRANAAHLTQQPHDAPPIARRHAGGRVIREDQVRFPRERAGQRSAASFRTRKFFHREIGSTTEAYEIHKFAHILVAFLHTRMQGQRPMVDAVANALAVSPRSLQRRLTESGTSYQRLLDEVRQQIARELLGATDLESGEIAFLLGFEEVNSFNRAFSAWEGTSPLRWRQRSQAAALPKRRLQ